MFTHPSTLTEQQRIANAAALHERIAKAAAKAGNATIQAQAEKAAARRREAL